MDTIASVRYVPVRTTGQGQQPYTELCAGCCAPIMRSFAYSYW